LENSEEQDLSAVQGFTRMMHRDAPQFAAAAVAQKSQKAPLAAAEMR
jgi:hypothetical protein